MVVSEESEEVTYGDNRYTYKQVEMFISGWPDVTDIDLFIVTGWTLEEFEKERNEKN